MKADKVREILGAPDGGPDDHTWIYEGITTNPKTGNRDAFVSIQFFTGHAGTISFVPGPPDGVSLTDLDGTARWIDAKQREYMKRTDNELAQARLMATFRKEMAKAQGKKVSWKMRVRVVRVSDDGKTARVVFSVPGEIYAEEAGRTVGLANQGLSVPAAAEWVSALKAGDQLTITGVCKSATATGDARTITPMIVLSDCSAHP
jgi:hypothetical protein